MTNNKEVPSTSGLSEEIATELSSVEGILEEIHAQKRIPREEKAVFVAPRTPTERKLAEIWAELLSLDRVSIHDDFFELGGHSLLATQVLSRVLEAFQVELPMRTLFDNEFTVARLAQIIDQQLIEEADTEEVASMLEEMSKLSDDEVRTLLASKGQFWEME